MSSNQRTIPSLDGIRAVSIILVLLSHLRLDWNEELQRHGNKILSFPLDIGSLGVRIFFIISGFLITGILLKELDRKGAIDLARFYFRRTLRIFPPFYFYIAVMIFLTYLGWSRLTPHGAVPSILYLSNYWKRWEESRTTLSHTWSLSTEEQFYLIWPFVLALCNRRRAPWILGSIVVLSPLVRIVVYALTKNISGQEFHLNADHIATGCLLAILHPKLHAMPIYRRLIDSRWMAIFPILIAFIVLLGNHPIFYRTIGFSILNLSIAICVDSAVTNHTSLVGRWLNMKWLTTIGVLSYSLYLWQQPFLHLHEDHPALILSGPWKILGNPILALACVFTCAVLSYYAIERPSLRLREWLEPILFRRRQEQAAAAPQTETAAGQGAAVAE